MCSINCSWYERRLQLVPKAWSSVHAIPFSALLRRQAILFLLSLYSPSPFGSSRPVYLSLIASSHASCTHTSSRWTDMLGQVNPARKYHTAHETLLQLTSLYFSCRVPV